MLYLRDVPLEVDTKIKLKRCPFCGADSNLVKLLVYKANNTTIFTGKYAVQCLYTGTKYGCGAEGQQNKSLEAAVAAWNLRRL